MGAPMLSRIGKFEVVKKLGEGAMGEVYLALDPIIGREVAIKTIHPNAATASDARDRFFREAQAAGRLNHPNLVTVHEFGEDQGLLFMAMEYVPGDDLTVLLQGRSLGPGEALEIMAQVCEGLGYAHQHGVLHRDVKPSNVRITRISGRPLAKVMDFGIARLAGSEMTGTGMLLGTFGYMAPEYIQSGKPDSRADIFAAGVMLYEALAGHKPFEGDTSATILYRIIHEDPLALDPSRIQGISPAIQALLKRALAKDPAARFQTGEAMAAALRAAKDPAWIQPLDLDATLRTGQAGRPSHPSPQGTKARALWPWAIGFSLLTLGAVSWAWTRRASRPALPVPPATALVAKVEPPPGVSQTPIIEAPELVPPTPAATTPPSRAARLKPEPKASLPEKVEPPPSPKIQTLEEAGAAIDSDPEAALAFLEAHVAEDPSSERGHALRIATLYKLERYDACMQAFRAAAKNGFRVIQMARFPRFRQVIEAEKADPKLPKHFKGLIPREDRPNRRPAP